jgi:hypothetical protein
MTSKEKRDIIKRGVERRIVNIDDFVKAREDEIARIAQIEKDYRELVERYKNDKTIKRQLKEDKNLVSLAGSKTKLVKILNSEGEFEKLIEAGMDMYRDHYAKIEQNYRMAIEEALASLPNAEYLFKVLSDETDEKILEVIDNVIDLFLKPVVVDWKDYEDRIAKEKEFNQENS